MENLLEAKLISLEKEPGQELAVSIERSRQEWERKRIGVLIDNLEPALNKQGCFEPLYHVEFSDVYGCEYAMATLTASESLVLHYEIFQPDLNQFLSFLQNGVN